MQQTAATRPCQLRAMPISSPPDAYVTSARCPCQSRAMPISLSRHAYVTLATCLCHFGEMPMSPAPHQKRPVYRCSGSPFFVLFGHFRHEMRIFPASEASFGADGTFVETVSVRQNLSDLWKICPDTHPRSQPTWLPSPLRQDKHPTMVAFWRAAIKKTKGVALDEATPSFYRINGLYFVGPVFF